MDGIILIKADGCGATSVFLGSPVPWSVHSSTVPERQPPLESNMQTWLAMVMLCLKARERSGGVTEYLRLGSFGPRHSSSLQLT